MIWHIFRKDWKLLWRMVVGVALLNVIYRVILSSVGPFANGRSSPLVRASYVVGTVSLVASGFLVVMVAQTDPIPGLRQDWLVRPIRRTDLLLSKLAFIALMVQGPIFVTEVAQGLAAGFPIGQCLGAPLARSLWMLCTLVLTVFAVASLTRNLFEAIGAGVGIVLSLALFVTATQGGTMAGTSNTGIAWITDSAQAACGLLGVAIVLALQYYRRKTTPARLSCGVALLAALFAQFLPWQQAFAIQERFSPQPSSSSAVQITFDPSRGPTARMWQGQDRRFLNSTLANDLMVFVPLRVSGINDDGMLMEDHIAVRVTEPDGRVTELGNVWGSGPLARGFEQPMWVPETLLSRSKNQAVRLGIDYSLTLLQPGPALGIAAANGHGRLADAGSCATRFHPEFGVVELGCITMGNSPTTTWFLKNVRTGAQDGESQGHPPVYSPWITDYERDSMRSVRGDLRLSDLPGSDVEDTQVVIRAYHPEAHFTRQVVIPDFRLNDWRPR
jgi:ABC-type transport system involved in multi-copper enzyme maturation permease subunit